MTWLWIAAVVAVLGAAIALVLGRAGGMPEVAPDRPAAQVPLGALTPDDLAKVRLSQALRGYSCDEVDDLLARLGAELRRRPPVDDLVPSRDADAAPVEPPAGEVPVTTESSATGAPSATGVPST